MVKRKSDVKYIIKDELDGQTIPVSVQQIVPFYGDDAVEGDEDDVVLQKSQLSQLKLGQFVAFKRHDDAKFVAGFALQGVLSISCLASQRTNFTLAYLLTIT